MTNGLKYKVADTLKIAELLNKARENKDNPKVLGECVKELNEYPNEVIAEFIRAAEQYERFANEKDLMPVVGMITMRLNLVEVKDKQEYFNPDF